MSIFGVWSSRPFDSRRRRLAVYEDRREHNVMDTDLLQRIGELQGGLDELRGYL